MGKILTKAIDVANTHPLLTGTAIAAGLVLGTQEPSAIIDLFAANPYITSKAAVAGTAFLIPTAGGFLQDEEESSFPVRTYIGGIIGGAAAAAVWTLAP